MGLINDDHAGAQQRRKNRRTGAEHNAGLAAAGSQPAVQALAVREARVQADHRYIEALFEAPHGLRGQADFRDQHQNLFAFLEQWLHRLQVDLGLATAGDAIKQERGEAPGALNRLDGGLLLGTRRGRYFRHQAARFRHLGVYLAQHHPALFLQRDQCAALDIKTGEHVRRQSLRVLLKQLQRLLLAWSPS